MTTTPSDVLTVAELQRLVAQVEPAALLVPPRILRRVIKRDRGLAGPGLQVPHRKSYVVARDRLLCFATAADFGVVAAARSASPNDTRPRPNAAALLAPAVSCTGPLSVSPCEQHPQG